MRKGLMVSLCVNGVFVMALLWKDMPAYAGRGGGAPSGNGDVNGDARIDISDPVYLLTYLFMGGPAPLPIDCPAPAGRALPATGQMKCFDQSGAEIPCDNAPCPGQDGALAMGCPSEGRFSDNGDGTVTDHCTGLMWQKDAADLNGDGRSTDQDSLPWCDALAFCENLSFAGHDDWRLPNVRELQSIVDYGRFNPSIDPVFSSLSSVYWSSSSVADSPASAWGVGFHDGFVDNFDGRVGAGHVRAVRNAP